MDDVLVGPIDRNRIQYDIRALDKYCKEKNIFPTDLSKEKLKEFEIPPEKIPVNL